MDQYVLQILQSKFIGEHVTRNVEVTGAWTGRTMEVLRNVLVTMNKFRRNGVSTSGRIYQQIQDAVKHCENSVLLRPAMVCNSRL